MSHVVLLGDSIFDNARYVPGRPPVIEQLRDRLPAGWQATLLARDGSVTGDVLEQLNRLPADASHLVVSVGGNDGLEQSSLLAEPAESAAQVLERLADVCGEVRNKYRRMLEAVVATLRPVLLCTIYDAIPGLDRADATALALFNDVILREAFAAGVPVVDLRLVCDRADDYSPLSPIEPSWIGGGKIARAIADAVTKHDLSRRQSVIFP
jgi:lysophospholipase L1-like esterase